MGAVDDGAREMVRCVVAEIRVLRVAVAALAVGVVALVVQNCGEPCKVTQSGMCVAEGLSPARAEAITAFTLGQVRKETGWATHWIHPPVTVTCADIESDGRSWPRGRLIELKCKPDYADAILIHELLHHILWDQGIEHDHPQEWFGWNGVLIRAIEAWKEKHGD